MTVATANPPPSATPIHAATGSNAATNTTATASSTSATKGMHRFMNGHRGMLHKQGRVFNNWRPRYFVLAPQTVSSAVDNPNGTAVKRVLRCYEDDEAVSAMADLVVDETLTMQEMNEELSGRKFVFVLMGRNSTGGSETMVLSAANEQDKADWIEAIVDSTHDGFRQIFQPDLWAQAFYPSVELSVTYAKSNYSADCGNQLRPLHVETVPVVTVKNFNIPASTSGKEVHGTDDKYTLLFIDADPVFDPTAPVDKSKDSMYLQWAVLNFNGKDFSSCDVLAPYQPPAPEFNSGMHRYFFLLFKQRSSISQTVHNDVVELCQSRKSFAFRKFISAMNFGAPAAINGFYAQWEECVDRLHKQMQYVPPETYRSRTQDDAVFAAEERTRSEQERDKVMADFQLEELFDNIASMESRGRAALTIAVSFCDKRSVAHHDGDVVCLADLQKPPKLSLLATRVADERDLYTVVMCDMDCPSRANPESRSTVHWLMLNVPAQSMAISIADLSSKTESDKSMTGDVVLPYSSPAPFFHTGLHRLVIAIHAQDRAFSSPQVQHAKQYFAKRECISFSSWLADEKATIVPKPVAISVALCEWEPIADDIHKQRNTKVPAKFLSPSQLKEKHDIATSNGTVTPTITPVKSKSLNTPLASGNTPAAITPAGKSGATTTPSVTASSNAVPFSNSGAAATAASTDSDITSGGLTVDSVPVDEEETVSEASRVLALSSALRAEEHAQELAKAEAEVADLLRRFRGEATVTSDTTDQPKTRNPPPVPGNDPKILASHHISNETGSIDLSATTAALSPPPPADAVAAVNALSKVRLPPESEEQKQKRRDLALRKAKLAKGLTPEEEAQMLADMKAEEARKAEDNSFGMPAFDFDEMASVLVAPPLLSDNEQCTIDSVVRQIERESSAASVQSSVTQSTNNHNSNNPSDAESVASSLAGRLSKTGRNTADIAEADRLAAELVKDEAARESNGEPQHSSAQPHTHQRMHWATHPVSPPPASSPVRSLQRTASMNPEYRRKKDGDSDAESVSSMSSAGSASLMRAPSVDARRALNDDSSDGPAPLPSARSASLDSPSVGAARKGMPPKYTSVSVNSARGPEGVLVVRQDSSDSAAPSVASTAPSVAASINDGKKSTAANRAQTAQARDRALQGANAKEKCRVMEVNSSSIFEGETMRKKIKGDLFAKDSTIWIDPLSRSLHWSKNMAERQTHPEHSKYVLLDSINTPSATPAGESKGLMKSASLNGLTIVIQLMSGDNLELKMSPEGTPPAVQRAAEWLKTIKAFSV